MNREKKEKKDGGESRPAEEDLTRVERRRREEPVRKRRAGGEGKIKPSRVEMRRRKESRKRRRLVTGLLVILGVGAMLAAGAVFDVPYINVVRRAGAWIADRFSSERAGQGENPDYIFLTDPQTGKRIEGEAGMLIALCREVGGGNPEREIILLTLMSYDVEGGRGELYLVPENSVAYNVSGEKVPLSRALLEQGGEDLLCTTAGNMTGHEVNYLALLEFGDALRLMQNIGFPPVTVGEETVLTNPLSGEANHLFAGQRIQDSDRLLCWLIATDVQGAWEAYARRLERSRDYLPVALAGLAASDASGLAEAIALSLGEGKLKPGTGSAYGDAAHLASFLQAFARLGEGELSFASVPAVEVLNGCGLPDLGKKVGDEIASLGLPVAGTGGNAKVIVDGEELNDFTHERSSIVYRSESRRVKSFAAYLGVLMSIDDVRFEPGPGSEVVIIAGRDLAS